MHKKALSRRDFINYIGMGGAAIGLNSLVNACVPKISNQPIPSGNDPDIELTIQAKAGQVQILEGRKTEVWQYEGEVVKGPQDALQIIPGSYLGPIIHARKGQAIRVTFTNLIPEPSIIHWHGLHVPESADGHPRLVIDPNETYVYDFIVMDRAGMYWYHPHPHGRTGVQAYHGLAGLFIVHDDEEDQLGLPSGEFDIPLAIQDRTFTADNQLEYNLNNSRMLGFLGERLLVNGKPDAELSAAARPYRLRVLNGSNARIYALAWSNGDPLTIIGTDGGLLEKAVERDFLVLSPGERIDLWADFSKYKKGDQLQLLNIDLSGNNSGGDQILNVKIDREEGSDIILPEKLSTPEFHNVQDALNANDPRTFLLSMGMEMRWLINGQTFEMEAVDENEKVRLDDLEVWEFINQSHHGMGNLPHPMHIHGLQFQIIARESEPDYQDINSLVNEGHVDEGWQDTVLVMPGERVRILLKFEDYEGLFLYHCHNLEHEDMGMMRNYLVGT